MIENLREQGQIKDLPYVQEEKNNLINIVGNIVEEVDVVERENKNGEAFKVANFSVVSKDDEGKEHSNIRILSSKLLKAKEQMKGQEEKKESVLGAIKKYQAEDKEKPKEKKEANKDAER